jgi:hypothetical protein
MSTGCRFFLFEEDGTLRKLPHRVLDGLVHGIDRLPQYAGRHLRAATVYVERVDGKPHRIASVQGSIFHFDSEGGLQRSLAASAFTALATFDALREPVSVNEPVVDISPKLERQRWERENRWQPTSADITRLVHAIWPEQAGRPVERPKPAVGIKKRRIPMSYQATNAVDKCLLPAINIQGVIGDLDDKDLKAFIAKCREGLEHGDPVSNEIWKGIIAAAEKRLEVRSIWRSGKGKWFAEVSKMVSNADPSGTAELIAMEFSECDGKAAAIRAAREMLARHAHKFDERVAIETRIYPEIEWDEPLVEKSSEM